MLKIMIEQADGDYEPATDVLLYPDAVMTVAEALANGPPEMPFELGYLGSASGAIGFALAHEYFDRKDRREASCREHQVDDLVQIAMSAARCFPVKDWKELRHISLARNALFREGPACNFDALIPRNAERTWIGSRKPTFAGVSVHREDRLRRDLKSLEMNWVVPEWMTFIEFENEGLKFTIARENIVSVRFFDDDLR